jgi:hypothetical protein
MAGLLTVVLSPLVFVSTHVAHLPLADYSLAVVLGLAGVLAVVRAAASR